jgi:hypothetical protein
MNLKILNEFLPEELSKYCLEFTGITYKIEKENVLDELHQYYESKTYEHWNSFITQRTIWVHQPYGVWPIEQIIGDYNDTHVLLTSEILSRCATLIGWARAEAIMLNCTWAGLSIYEATELVDYWVLNEPVRYPELVEMYYEITGDRVGSIPLEFAFNMNTYYDQ